MADSGKSKKAGRSNKGDLGRLTTAKHRARRIKREEQRQALNATLRPARLRLRKIGALRRINRRLAAAIEGNKPTAALLATQAKAAAAVARAHP